MIVYGPPLETTLSDVDKVELFHSTFRDIGRVIYNEFAGDRWMQDLEFYEDKKGEL